ncbi:MAG: FtsK/SpoIIIE domain-containing protein, partial [Alphaproteobacteria bacterium]|nr:FtsK/SpoIIIE domain-containing protein [Alphaproteobacteria bacterium]
IGVILSFAINGIGWIPLLFVLLYITRLGAVILLNWENETPEYDAMRAFIATVFGAAGLGLVIPAWSSGGLVGTIIHSDLSGLVGGSIAMMLGILFIGMFLLMSGILLHIKWANVMTVYRGIISAARWIGSVLHLIKVEKISDEDDTEEIEEDEEEKEKKTCAVKKVPAKKITSHQPPAQTTNHDDYELPSPELVEQAKFSKHAVTADLKRTAAMLETHFQDYGVYGKVMGIEPGPIVTLYKFEPDAGMRIAKIADTVKDMTRAMATENIRIAHIPRSNYIGVEMVNLGGRQIVRFRGLVDTDDFIHSRLNIPLALGVNIAGDPMYYDLAKMPHVLIAGRTGSGKSVFVQSIIMSVLYHFRPDECKLIMVDPKGVDFTIWKDIPHLITPVVTDANAAVNTLKWCVREMEERYKKLKDAGAQNIEGFNEVAASGKKITKQVAVGTDPETGALEFETQEIEFEHMPYLVVIIDEVADLMSVARKEVEACVQRLAQKARAAGIHLAMATQRPDTSVITGVIKANFPTRISFQARSNIDSMTTLGEKGAEQLLANGDMLFSEAGRVPVRIHSAWIEGKEMKRVADFIRAQAEPEYVDGIGDAEESSSGYGGDASAYEAIPGMPRSKSEKDGDAYRQAVEYVTRDRKPTISYIQRRLGIGYNKAATFIERMEAEGIVSGPDANNKRHIL